MIKSTSTLSDAELQHHQLIGLHYSENRNPEHYRHWKNLLIKNHLVSSELKILGEVLQQKSIEVTLLKGFSLLGDIYEDWGARFASDVDCLVSPSDLPACIKALEECGFVKREEKTWLGNQFKVILIKKTPLLSVTMELHTKLFWHIDNHCFDKMDQDIFNGFKILDYEDQLIHLCGHLGFQHTFIKLFWLFDIKRYLDKHSSSIDWEKFWGKANDYKLVETCLLCLSLSGYGSYSQKAKKGIKQYLLQTLCSDRFLISPRKHKVRYFLIKFLIKDRWIDNIKYTLAWLSFRNEKKCQSV